MNQPKSISIQTSLQANVALLRSFLPIGRSFDLMTRDLLLGKTRAFWIGLNGFCVSELLEKMFGALQGTEGDQTRLPQLSSDGKAYDGANVSVPNATASNVSAPDVSAPDVSTPDVSALHAYLEDRADPKLVQKIAKKIDSLRVTALTMGAKSLEELLVKRRFFNPLPSLQMTERPDVAASYLAEGYVLLLVDNTPMVLVLPCTIFHFTQTAEDYYKNPLVGTYLRFIRFLCIPVALLFLPLFFLITAYAPALASSLKLVATELPSKGRLFLYVLIVEFFLALFQYSASLSSDRFSGALSIVGGLLIGDMAVSLHWSTSEVLFYGGVTLLATISVSCVELSDALRLYRMFLILCIFFGGVPGFWSGLGLVLLSILTTPTFGGYSYFWPLLPWNGKALVNLLLRTPTAKAQPSKVWNR